MNKKDFKEQDIKIGIVWILQAKPIRKATESYWMHELRKTFLYGLNNDDDDDYDELFFYYA